MKNEKTRGIIHGAENGVEAGLPMMLLTAEGKNPQEHWQGILEPHRTYKLGRAPESEIPIPWDPCISRLHATLTRQGDRLIVEVSRQAANFVFYQGGNVQQCELVPGEFFVIGQTSFRWKPTPDSRPSTFLKPADELTFSREALERVSFPDPDKRIEVLSRLPEVIWGARTDEELYLRLVNLLLAGIPQADAAALLSYQNNEIQILHWDRRRETAGELQPSKRLVRDALQEKRQSVLHFWSTASEQTSEYTSVTDLDWAFCTPVRGGATNGWGLYLAGQTPHSRSDLRPDDHRSRLQSDIKFAELVAEIVSSVRRLSQLERRQSGLRQFFPPTVLSAVGEDFDLNLLQPREADVTILFCDLRGFSKRSEEERDDLLGLLDRVSEALGLMTHQILKHGGGVGELLGDAALGFWGWPMVSGEAPVNACLAALGIYRKFTEKWAQSGHTLHDFRVGIGLAQGRAVAGKIGTQDHVKVTVFGPVVNLASRLEGMTKQLRVPILIDEAMARIIREKIPADLARVRKLARVIPPGFEKPVTVSELLPPQGDLCALTDDDLDNYERAVDAFIAGRWDEAFRFLHRLPETDHAQDFLAVQIAQHNRTAPAGWDGVIRFMDKK